MNALKKHTRLSKKKALLEANTHTNIKELGLSLCWISAAQANEIKKVFMLTMSFKAYQDFALSKSRFYTIFVLLVALGVELSIEIFAN